MSSIYRKGGSDGYYYYQTYIYNPDTGKKDKRIFHSLSTRQLPEAEIKQTELDKKYEHQELSSPTTSKITFLLQHKRTMVLIGSTAMVTVLVLNLFRSNPSPQVILNNQIVTPSESQKDEIILPELKLPKSEDETTTDVSKPDHEVQQVPPKLTIPKHTVQRVESISSVFQQGKVYITVDAKTSTERLRLLCKSITSKYPEFSNIVICLYASNAVGIELAKGTGSNFSLKKQNEAWLVFYSYNPVEGEYYDDEPGKYLDS